MKKSFLILFFVFSFHGCATLFKGSTEPVIFSSVPTSAIVSIDGVNMGKAPIRLQLKSNKTYNIEFKLDGYETKNVILNNKVEAGWIILDILGGLFPIIIDAATGDWYSLETDNVNAQLEKK